MRYGKSLRMAFFQLVLGLFQNNEISEGLDSVDFSGMFPGVFLKLLTHNAIWGFFCVFGKLAFPLWWKCAGNSEWSDLIISLIFFCHG